METKYGVLQIITILCVTYVQKDFKIWTLIKQLLANINFSRNFPKFHIFTKIIF